MAFIRDMTRDAADDVTINFQPRSQRLFSSSSTLLDIVAAGSVFVAVVGDERRVPTPTLGTCQWTWRTPDFGRINTYT